jgi:hypothetical protein
MNPEIERATAPTVALKHQSTQAHYRNTPALSIRQHHSQTEKAL